MLITCKEEIICNLNVIFLNLSVQFWKFAVTGADNNTEIKVWSCETWMCQQTLR